MDASNLYTIDSDTFFPSKQKVHICSQLKVVNVWISYWLVPDQRVRSGFVGHWILPPVRPPLHYMTSLLSSEPFHRLSWRSVATLYHLSLPSCPVFCSKRDFFLIIKNLRDFAFKVSRTLLEILNSFICKKVLKICSSQSTLLSSWRM